MFCFLLLGGLRTQSFLTLSFLLQVLNQLDDGSFPIVDTHLEPGGVLGHGDA